MRDAIAEFLLGVAESFSVLFGKQPRRVFRQPDELIDRAAAEIIEKNGTRRPARESPFRDGES